MKLIKKFPTSEISNTLSERSDTGGVCGPLVIHLSRVSFPLARKDRWEGEKDRVNVCSLFPALSLCLIPAQLNPSHFLQSQCEGRTLLIT